MRHKFYLPIGMPTFYGAPSTSPEVGDTYFDTATGRVCTWDGTRWTSGGGTLSPGAGLGSSSTSLTDDVTIWVNPGPGIYILGDTVALDETYTDNRYVKKAGDTMIGALQLPAANPTRTTDATHKAYVDAKTAAIAGFQITAGQGLRDGGLISTNPTLNVGAGTGISVSSDLVALDTNYTDARYSPAHTHPYASSSHDHSTLYSRLGHAHSYGEVGLWVGTAKVSAGNATLAADATAKVRFTHNLRKTILGAWATAYGDSGTNLSLVASVFETANPLAAASNTYIDIFVRNISGVAEDDCAVSVLLIY